MDSNDPANTNSNTTGNTPIPLGDAVNNTPAAPSASPSPWAQPSTPMPDASAPAPVESLPGSAPTDRIISDITVNPPETASPWGQPVASAPTTPLTPWNAQSIPPTPVDPMAAAAAPTPPVTPIASAADTNVTPESPWGSSSGDPSQSVATSDVPTAPQAPATLPPENPAASNPFLQPNAGTAFTLPQAPLPDSNPIAAAPPAAAPNPSASTTPDPLNTAFAQNNPSAQNPFGSPQSTLPVPGDINPVSPSPATPSAHPWDLPTAPMPGTTPADATLQSPPAQTLDPVEQSTGLNIGQPQPAGTAENFQGAGQAIPNNPQTGPLDLSALQNSPTPSPSEQPVQPGNPLPETGPTENAPTDLSHLIAGDEQSSGGQQIPGVYTPPVATDQNPATSPVQVPTSEGSEPPPGKHLNLTKVLLVAGIPVILIVAALSAYLILGVGQAKPPTQTSLPVDQTKTQAPLTNPPQQIVAPSPALIPEPSLQVSPSPMASLSPSPSPAASLSPAMQAAQRKASPSPSGAASPSPAASASTSLPL